MHTALIASGVHKEESNDYENGCDQSNSNFEELVGLADLGRSRITSFGASDDGEDESCEDGEVKKAGVKMSHWEWSVSGWV